MNKSEMAEKLAAKADIPKAKAAEIIDHIFSTKDGEGIIAVELDAGRKVNITGFGSFTLKRRSERWGRNPATGETIAIPARNYASFSASRGLKARVATEGPPGTGKPPPPWDDEDTLAGPGPPGTGKPPPPWDNED